MKSRSPPRIRKGQIVAVDFLDHVEGADHPLAFTVYGRVGCVTPQSITVDSWCYADKTQASDQNVGRFTIVRSAIRGIRRLTEA